MILMDEIFTLHCTVHCPIHVKNIANLRHVWIPLRPDYWSIEVCKTSTNKLYSRSHTVTSFYFCMRRTWGTHASSFRILPREIFGYMSITIQSIHYSYDRSSFKFNMMHKRCACIDVHWNVVNMSHLPNFLEFNL
jgi:hypothetical protein